METVAMPHESLWASIITAVKNPIALAALVVLVFMVILRAALSRVPTLRQNDSYRALRYVVTVVGIVALVVVLGALVVTLVQARKETVKFQLERDVAEQSSGSQLHPRIREELADAIFNETFDAARVPFRLINDSGFDAYDVQFDMKFGKNAWLTHWLEAEADRLQQVKSRTPQDEQRLRELLGKPWVKASIKAGESADGVMGGSLSRDFVCNTQEGIEVRTRSTWKNEKGHPFGRTRNFKLVCTRVDTGMVSKFVPQGTAAQDE